MSQNVGFIVGNKNVKRNLSISAGQYISEVSMFHRNSSYTVSSNESIKVDDISPSEGITVSAELPPNNIGPKEYYDGITPKEGNYYYTPVCLYSFDGWYDSNDNLVDSNTVYSFGMPTHNYTLTAVGNKTITESDRKNAILSSFKNSANMSIKISTPYNEYNLGNNETTNLYSYQLDSIDISGNYTYNFSNYVYSSDCNGNRPTSLNSYVDCNIYEYYINNITDDTGITIENTESNNTICINPNESKNYTVSNSSRTTTSRIRPVIYSTYLADQMSRTATYGTKRDLSLPIYDVYRISWETGPNYTSLYTKPQYYYVKSSTFNYLDRISYDGANYTQRERTTTWKNGIMTSTTDTISCYSASEIYTARLYTAIYKIDTNDNKTLMYGPEQISSSDSYYNYCQTVRTYQRSYYSSELVNGFKSKENMYTIDCIRSSEGIQYFYTTSAKWRNENFRYTSTRLGRSDGYYNEDIMTFVNPNATMTIGVQAHLCNNLNSTDTGAVIGGLQTVTFGYDIISWHQLSDRRTCATYMTTDIKDISFYSSNNARVITTSTAIQQTTTRMGGSYDKTTTTKYTTTYAPFLSWAISLNGSTTFNSFTTRLTSLYYNYGGNYYRTEAYTATIPANTYYPILTNPQALNRVKRDENGINTIYNASTTFSTNYVDNLSYINSALYNKIFSDSNNTTLVTNSSNILSIYEFGIVPGQTTTQMTISNSTTRLYETSSLLNAYV